MQFEFATAGRILFGPGTAKGVAPAAAAMGSRPLLVTGFRGTIPPGLAATARLQVEGEPSIDLVRQGAALAREQGCDMVVAIGGGSAIDAGKAIATLLANPGDPLDYLEVVGRGQALANPSVPFIAVPTTAGTGSEVTRNAVLASPGHRVKASLRSPYLLPRLAVIDPELTFDLPPAVTASTGLDALTQLIEPYVSTRANPITDAFCLEGLPRAARSLARAYENGRDAAARTDMCLASLFGGLALANAGLGAVHGFAAPIGGMFPAPHGAVCAALLPHAFDVNVRALSARAAGSDALRRYETVARILTGDPDATPAGGAAWLAHTCERLEIPRLRAYGIAGTDIPTLVENAARASSMKGNPIALTEGELREIINRAL